MAQPDFCPSPLWDGNEKHWKLVNIVVEMDIQLSSLVIGIRSKWYIGELKSRYI